MYVKLFLQLLTGKLSHVADTRYVDDLQDISAMTYARLMLEASTHSVGFVLLRDGLSCGRMFRRKTLHPSSI